MSGPTGGTITTDGSYTIHTFTTSGTFTPNKSGNVDVLLVGGGGGGGGFYYAGGGGGGVVSYNASHAVTAQAYTVTVGDGGAGGSSSNDGTAGGASSFDGITANGGTGGHVGNGTVGDHGSGGGGAVNSGGQGGTSNLTPMRGAGGGGGNGAGGSGYDGYNGGVGGAGTSNSISGSAVMYGGGGGGGAYFGGNGATGTDGGGSGAGANRANGTDGTANRGGGGGGCSHDSYGTTAGAGGSGIVIIRYLTDDFLTTGAITESASVDDSMSTLMTEFNESASANDSISATRYMDGVLTESSSVHSEMEVFPGFIHTVEDTITLVDDISMDKTTFATISDLLAVYDSGLPALVRTLVDTFMVYDQINIGWSVPVESAISLTETLIAILDLIAEEWLSLVETLSENWNGKESITDVITIWDLTYKGYDGNISESISFVDTPLLSLTVSLLEYLGFNDIVSTIQTMYSSLSESISTTDSANLGIPLSVESLLSVIDISSVISSFLHSVQSDLNLTEVMTIINNMSLSSSESLVFVDNISNTGHIYNAVYETLELDVIISLDNEIWECYVLNTPKFHSSMYSGFDFNSYCTWNKRSFGANKTGIFELIGDTDNGSSIHTGVIFSRTDFNSPNKKRFRRGYFGISGDAPLMILETETGERQAFSIDSKGKAIGSHELKSRKWTLSIADFESLDNLKLIPVILTRF